MAGLPRAVDASAVDTKIIQTHSDKPDTNDMPNNPPILASFSYDLNQTAASNPNWELAPNIRTDPSHAYHIFRKRQFACGAFITLYGHWPSAHQFVPLIVLMAVTITMMLERGTATAMGKIFITAPVPPALSPVAHL
jgi:hypothetical protein